MHKRKSSNVTEVQDYSAKQRYVIGNETSGRGKQPTFIGEHIKAT
jgi:hypothetical protein